MNITYVALRKIVLPYSSDPTSNKLCDCKSFHLGLGFIGPGISTSLPFLNTSEIKGRERFFGTHHKIGADTNEE